jgi:hypothetical protein
LQNSALSERDCCAVQQIQSELGTLTPILGRFIHTLERARTKMFRPSGQAGTGRRPYERACLAKAFLAKAVLGVSQTRALHFFANRRETRPQRMDRRPGGAPAMKPRDAMAAALWIFFRCSGLSARKWRAGSWRRL